MASDLEERVLRSRSSGAGQSTEALATRSGRSEWYTTVQRALVVSDLLTLLIVSAVAVVGRFGAAPLTTVDGLNRRVSVDGADTYLALSAVIVLVWMTFLWMQGSRARRVVGVGPDEYKRVLSASAQVFALTAIVAYLTRVQISRFYTAVLFALGALTLLLTRWVFRKWLHRQRLAGGWAHRVLVVGDRQHVSDLTEQLERETYAGLRVVGACLPEGDEATTGSGDLRVVGSLTNVPEAAEAVGADTIAVVPSAGMNSTVLRRLSWSLEGTGIDLIVAPALTDVAGPRVHVRPVAGVPLLHVEAPEYEGPMRVVKAVFDVVMACALLVLLSPVMIVIAAAIKLTSRGPALFRQERVGRNGKSFTLLKFRSMVQGAENMLGAVIEHNENDGVLFKMREDPRVTTVGRIIRRYSLDELPQLFNVVFGTMSLVGPRPPLPSEVAQYGFDVRRRLLVKPGVTGLWQVSGRSDLTWDDSVRLDLYYVENWSMTGDIVILWKTVAAVLSGRGAY